METSGVTLLGECLGVEATCWKLRQRGFDLYAYITGCRIAWLERVNDPRAVPSS